MGKYEDKKTYIHYSPPVRVVPEWEKGFNFYLIENMEQFKESFKGYLDGSRAMAFDTETSSLDPENGKIVGFSYCLDGQHAYYVAVDHCIDTYNLGDEAMDFIYTMLCASKRVIMFNARFDIRMMEYYGYTPNMGRFLYVRYDMSKIRIYDVSVPCWLSDTNVRMPSLKESALRFLGYKMQTYAEVSDGVENFYYIDPKDCFFYAASDALCSYLLVGATYKFYQEAPQINKLDMAVLYPLLHCENEKVYIDGKLLNNLEVQCTSTIEQLEKEIYDEVGYHFNLNSPAQVSQAFSRLGIDTKSTTKTGYMKTGIDDLEALPEDVKNQHPALAKFIKYKSMFKFTSSYVKVLQKCYREKGYIRSSYKTQTVPTGRLASGKDSKNTFFSEINTQSIPKPHPRFYYVLDLGDRTLFNKKDNIILGYQFIPVKYLDNDKTHMVSGKELYPENYMFLSEGMDQDYNVRASFLPKFEPEQEENDIVFCSIDFASQELRIVANFSHESVWVNAFKNGEDIHKSTAQKVWGEDNYDKEKRKLAKGVNFSVIYGAEAQSFVGDGKTKEKPEGMTLAEADDFFASYKKGLPSLFSYQERLIRTCRQKGIVYSFFGRPRRVKYYFDNRQIGFGKRTILNNPVQGSAGDVLKMVLCKLWRLVLNHPDYRDDVKFRSTVHDEINFGIKKERLTEIARELEKSMTFEIVEWEVPLTVEVSFGWTWGGLFSFEWDDYKQQYVPKES